MKTLIRFLYAIAYTLAIIGMVMVCAFMFHFMDPASSNDFVLSGVWMRMHLSGK